MYQPLRHSERSWDSHSPLQVFIHIEHVFLLNYFDIRYRNLSCRVYFFLQLSCLNSDWPHLYQIVPPDLVEMPIFNGDMSALASEFVDWLNRLRQQERSLSYIHFDAVDKAGHADGFGSTSYYEALRRVDFLVASIIAAAERLDPIIVLLRYYLSRKRHSDIVSNRFYLIATTEASSMTMRSQLRQSSTYLSPSGADR